MLGITLLMLLLFVYLFGSFFCPFDPTSTCLDEKNMPPSFLHWFGTDDLGRDLFARTLQGLGISCSIGAAAAFIDLCIGTIWGTACAFSSPVYEKLLMRMAEIIYSIPYLLMVILFSVFIGTGFCSILVAMVCIGWIHMARIVRHLVKSLKTKEYILAAETLGASSSRQFFSHMIPNMIGPVMAACMLSIPHAIFTEAFLSFMGIGIQPPTASLGSMIADSIAAMRFYPWRLLFPAGILSMLIFSIMLIGDSLRDFYDPKKRLTVGDPL